jgi:8-oxo-dGTP pyrophosphatase MutT (NUDIX family)
VTIEKPARQVAALPFRKRRGKLEVLLITSRETKRWIIPKGWPMADLKDYNAARREALEEAGVKGQMGKNRIGRFNYEKRLKSGATKLCQVDVFSLHVRTTLKNYSEMGQRQRCWYRPEVAATLVQEPQLRVLVLTLHQKMHARIAKF